ncbi:pyridoxal phosphate-dependent transferase [Amylocystis lapponica]|nr:pyridoxal phosphate-dependent transferase [Amylocystis lapponica]
MSLEKYQKALDLSHHLSDVSRARQTSPLKGLQPRDIDPSKLINLAGGMPNEDYFPFSNISSDVLVSDAFSLSSARKESYFTRLWKLFSSSTEKTNTISVPRYAAEPGDLSLAVSLQYGQASGLAQLQVFIKHFVAQVYRPGYSDWTILVHTGNTDGWSRVVQMLCNPGETILTEEWTYPSALATAKPFGVHAVPIAMDKDGMSAVHLRKVLSEWDEGVKGKRPHVMYTVPIGQNPSGSTMDGPRKKEVYDVCSEFDVIIVEDDPYYFLQEGEYVPKSQRDSHYDNGLDDKTYLDQLAPSYLRFDTEGRVIRLDTFSKYLAPGLRLGWHTCNPLFAERLERHGETASQAPSGLSQILVTQLLTHWKFEGYVRWLQGLVVQYKIRRDVLVDAFAEDFDLRSTSTTHIDHWKGMAVLNACMKPAKGASMLEKSSLSTRTLFSFVPPTSGMFIWVVVHLESHPAFGSEPAERIEMQLWDKLIDAGILIAPGWLFGANADVAFERGTGHFRIAFSNVTYDKLRESAKIFARVTQEFFQQQ